MKAHKRSDRAALARVADRMGLVRLGEATASREPGVGEAALSALPLVRGGVLLIGAAADQISVADWPRAAAAATALGALLDGAVPTALEEWEVPPDVVARACTALRALAWRSDAAVATRLAALDAVAAAAPSCGSGADSAPLARDGTPALRRAATAVAAVGNERETLLRDAIADADRTVSTAATAAACRIETRTGPRRQDRAAAVPGGRGGAHDGDRAHHAARRCGRDARLPGGGGNAAGPRAARRDPAPAAVAAARSRGRAGRAVAAGKAVMAAAPPAPSTPSTTDDGGARLTSGARRLSALTMLSRLLGLVREQVFAITLGAGVYSDAFLAAFRIPNLLRDLFAEGALSTAFVPTYVATLAARVARRRRSRSRTG